MLLSKRIDFGLNLSIKAISRLIGLGLILAALSGCQVKPLYSSSTSTSLPPIEISDADDRLEQVVRNQLVFLTGSSNSDAAVEYTLDLNVSRSASGVLDSGTDNNFTAGKMVVTGSYKLAKTTDGEVIKQGSRSSTALYDLPDQEFAKIRALRDAEDRAGRELAELLYADIAIVLRQ